MSLVPPDIPARQTFEERYELRFRLWLDGPYAGHLAFDRVLGREVVVNVAYGASDAGAMIGRARTIARLRHPNVLPIFDLGITGEGLPFFTKPWIRLESMIFLLRAAGDGGANSSAELPLKTFVSAVRDACLVLIHARSHGYAHGGFCPGSILLGGDHREVFIEDGWERIRDDEPEEDHPMLIGHLSYMDPARIRDGKSVPDPVNDVFCLGGALHLILYGTPPNHVQGRSNHWELLLAMSKGEFDWRKPGKLRPNIRTRGLRVRRSIRELERICQRSLDADLARRHPGLESLLRDLDAWLDRG